MIQKFIWGNPLNTEAVQTAMEASPACALPACFKVTSHDGFSFSCSLEQDTIVYGLGETVRGINKRGWLYISDCCDEKDHFEDKNSLYCAHNFLVLDTPVPCGLFFDYPGILSFDIGYTRQDLLHVTASDANLALYLITGDDVLSVIREFRQLIGPCYIAPKWAFGYQQSRWGYGSQEDVYEVAEKYRQAGLPLDAIGLDIDYMERYKDFTVDTTKFPDFSGLVSRLLQEGIRLVPIIDAGVKIEKGYEIYEEGVQNNYFCKRADGTDFVAGVWPGRSHFPDMLNQEAREWFGSKYEKLTSQGIEGFWNDMNEPAIFYSEEGLQQAWDTVDRYRHENLDVHTFFELEGVFSNAAGSREDYTRFYHTINGQKVRHDKVHNLYGYYMTRSAHDGLKKLLPKKRFLLFSRSSYIGMHRYGGTWTGDNKAWWSHILLNLKMLPSLNMCGFLYTGADLGGFAGNTTRDLMLRWIALSVFTPLMRNHARSGTRLKECYQFEGIEDFRNMLRVRYALIPYLYSEYMKASLQDAMMFRPLAFDYPNDQTARHIEDQMMLGEGLMIAPVYEQNAAGRLVYLPEDMLFVKFTSDTSYTFHVLQKGAHYIDVTLHEVPLFLRPNHLLPLCKGADCVEKLDTGLLTILGYVTQDTTYTLYEDDGVTLDYNLARYGIQLSCSLPGHDTSLVCSVPGRILDSRIVTQ